MFGKRKVVSSIPGKALPLNVQKVPARASKVAGEASTLMDVDSNSDIHEFPLAKELRDATNYHWVVAHVTLPSWKQHLKEISIEQLCDIHDRAYMCAIRAQELKKDRAYAKLERKCNEAFQGQVDGLHNSLKHDRAAVVFEVIPDTSMKLIHSDGLDVLIVKLVRSSIIYGRCQTFEEVAAIKEPFVLEKMSGYRPSSKEEYDQAGDALANSSYPFLAEYVVNPYASLK
ncbi:hypothetical protein Tco_0393653 [Tanacetum coccineum]